MSKKFSLTAEKRDGAGKGIARALRRENKIPAVVYGDSKEPVSITLPLKEVTLEYRKGYMFTHLCEIDVAGQKHLTLARDVQLHPVTDKIIHVDFLRVTPKTRIKVDVPVHFINDEECKGLKAGGVLNVVHHEVVLECAATDIPEFVEVDLTNYDLGDVIHMDVVKLPKGATSVLEGDETIATIAVPRAVVEVEDAPVAADAVPASTEKKAAE
ncbi:50S ribosomal protein L25/general stress protein Ctc [Micavibrio aeruginosavorus]|uniref:Large ribosomal subunit protein bL25 n=1 Tax=Micavibrio aeruginosavorus (strain ARL-13) TaxID=856793 RepID=G2KSI7_MICAA|nr:50S ribosomal protein L25/general stress protein Ctc [Micavibrio aeruginosavorus]AEP09271.1 ribosomal protein L25, Ctc-form [Micavibrio aeruginosavorus ARL-13]